MLKRDRDKSVLARHPWIFSGAVEHDPQPASGATVDIRASDGRWLARGAYSPVSQIRARVWTLDAAEAIDDAFFARRAAAAVAKRAAMFDAGHTAARLVHAESDGLPGIIADRYADTIVVQLLSAGADAHRDSIVDALVAATGVTSVVERSDAEVRVLEGLAPATGVIRGRLASNVAIREDGIAYVVDVLAGQKTGFYLDQRVNRRIVREHAAGRRVLNAFCYTGGFTLAAIAGGAREVLSIDSSQAALAQGRANLAANPSLAGVRARWKDEDVFSELRALRNAGESFDLIVLDPPKFAPTAALAAKASRAYKDINLLALKLLVPGGLLATFSCSGGVSQDLFQKIVAGAAVDARTDATIVARMQAAPDHPLVLAFPEGEYLKGLLLQKAG